MAHPKNSESQANSASRNSSKGVCDKNPNHKRDLHWRDVQNGDLDCTACDGKYVVQRSGGWF